MVRGPAAPLGPSSRGGSLASFLEVLEARPRSRARACLAQATALAPTQEAEVLVLDLPELDPAHLRTLRGFCRRRRGAVVVLTREPDPERHLQAVEAGADEVVTGDPTCATLARLLPLVLARARRRPAGPSPEELSRKLRRELNSLRRDREQLSLVFEQAPDALFLSDATGRLLAANPKAEELTGHLREEMIGETLATLGALDAGDLQELRRATACTALGMATLVCLRMKSRDGRQVPVEVVSYPVTGQGRQVLTVVRDVTERQRTEEELRATRDGFRDLVDQVRDGLLVVSPEAEVLFANTAAAGMLGRPGGELLGRRLELPCPREESPEEIPLANSGTARVSAVRTTWHQRPAQLVVLRDVTPLREAEKAVRQKEEELLRAQRMQAVGRLAGGIAHDFNNLLTAILDSVRFLLEELPPDESGHRRAEEIRALSQRAVAVVGQVLAFSQRNVAQPRAMTLNELVQRTEPLLAGLVADRAQLSLQLDPEPGRIEADPGQFEQVLMNLALNAPDAMPGGGRLQISTGRCQRDGRAWSFLRVRDDGCGISPEVLPAIFEPFFTTKTPESGLGLGLSTVYGIVKQSGGQVNVDSRVGEGATFEILLPALPSPEAVEPPPPPRRVPEGRRPQAPQTILLVEDEEVVRRLEREVLERIGYRVLEAGDGLEALHLCENHPEPIDLMITDVVMPRMHGGELARRVGHVRPEMRVVFTSGYTDSELARHGVLSPTLAFLPKPFTALELARKVRAELPTSRA